MNVSAARFKAVVTRRVETISQLQAGLKDASVDVGQLPVGLIAGIDNMKRIPGSPHYRFSGISEVSMSAVADHTLAVNQPPTLAWSSIRIPLFGTLWVVTNVALGALGIYINWPVPCAFLAGLINGTLLGVIAVSTASERLQAGTTGLLGGLSLSALRSDGSMVWKAMQGLHGFVDNVFHTMGIELNENLHHALQQEALYMIWTIVFVVMASLVAEWVRSARAQADRGPLA
jgi:hypothetical protein